METNPKITTTERDNKPLQENFGLSAAQTKAFLNVACDQVRPHHGTNTKQLLFSEIPTKERFVEVFEWTTGQPINTVLYTKNINFEFLSQFTERINDTFVYLDFTNLVFTIRATQNAAYQGEAWLYYDPTPYPDFLKEVYGLEPDIYARSQLDRITLNPTSSGEYTFTIPIIFPFDMFYNTKVNGNYAYAEQQLLAKYLLNYSFGRIQIVSVAPLETKNPVKTALSYSIALSLTDVNYGGTDYYLNVY